MEVKCKILRKKWKTKGKILGYFAFSPGKSKKPPLSPRKVKILGEKSKFRGILHFPLEKVKNLHFSPRKVKILGEKSKYRGKSKIPRKKHFFLLKFRPDELPLRKEGILAHSMLIFTIKVQKIGYLRTYLTFCPHVRGVRLLGQGVRFFLLFSKHAGGTFIRDGYAKFCKKNCKGYVY